VSPVRALLWLVGLFALAVTLTAAARYSPGYVLLVLPFQRVELSLNLVVVLLLSAFAVAYVLVRALSLTLRIPARAAEFRRERQQARARRAFQEAVRNFFEGRFGRAERAARQALESDEAADLTLALAARAAHELRSFRARDEYLREMDIRAPHESYLRLMTLAELLLDERRYHDALQALSKLPDKHTAALRLELRAQQLAKNWDQVLQLLPQLDRRRVFEPSILKQIRHQAQTENLKRKALDGKILREYWERLPVEDRQDARVAATAAQCFIALGGVSEAHDIVEQSLEANWSPELLVLYVECLPRDARRHLERAESWLQRHPGDPVLLLALGKLCMQQALWGKARSYLEASLAIEPTHSAYVEFGKLLERIGDPKEAGRMYRKGLEHALTQLKSSTGGRRHVVL
jgi:HemY protein